MDEPLLKIRNLGLVKVVLAHVSPAYRVKWMDKQTNREHKSRDDPKFGHFTMFFIYSFVGVKETET